MNLRTRFLAKVTQGPECWTWNAATDNFGYGRIWYNGRMEPAYRVSWIIHNGPIPDGQNVLHKCDNPPCTNSAHLFLGTQSENLKDMGAKGRHWLQQRTECAYGHPLTSENLYNWKGRHWCKTCYRRRNRENMRAYRLRLLAKQQGGNNKT